MYNEGNYDWRLLEKLPDKIQRLTEEYPNKSMAEIINMLDDTERDILFEGFTEEDMDALFYDAEFWLRPKQKISTGGDTYITALIAGRG